MTKVLSRRTLLKGAGVALALPWLDAMGGKAYLGFHGALFDYEPVSGRFTELASSRSLAPPRHEPEHRLVGYTGLAGDPPQAPVSNQRGATGRHALVEGLTLITKGGCR